jgi:hypothetical protein
MKPLKPRADYPILKKGGYHGQTKKAKRVEDKRKLQIEIKQGETK